MKRFSIIGVVTVLVAGVLWVSPASAAEEKFGVIEEERWTAEDGPYEITGPLVINSLVVEEGTEVIVQGNYPITVAGTLEVNGEAGEPAVFTYKTETAGSWPGIRFADSQDGSEIEYLEVSYADTGIVTNRNEWTVEDSHLHDNETGADLAGTTVGDAGSGSFVRNYVEDNDTGVKITARVADFEHNTLTGNDTGISFSTTSGEYSENNIFGNSEDATTCNYLAAGEVNATDNYWGTTDEDDIADAICDGNDADNFASPDIDFSGFETAPVPDAAELEEPAPSPSPSVSSSPSAAPPVQHSRTVTLVVRRHVRVSGTVTVTDGYGGCLPAGVTIKFKAPKRTWKTIKTVPFDPTTQTYASRLKDRKGVYQASVAQTSTDRDVCLAAVSPKVRHRHN